MSDTAWCEGYPGDPILWAWMSRNPAHPFPARLGTAMAIPAPAPRPHLEQFKRQKWLIGHGQRVAAQEGRSAVAPCSAMVETPSPPQERLGKSQRRWTPEEIAQLREEYPLHRGTGTVGMLATKLGRTYAEVNSAASRYGIAVPRRSYVEERLQQIAGAHGE